MLIDDLIEKWDINPNWTLFLDRDGVINHETVGNYITSVNNFKFIDGAKESIGILSKLFNNIIIVTNQQGIGKKLMSETDLVTIHKYMISEIEKEGGKIDAIYHSPFLTSDKNPMQKPGIGMALKAKSDIPNINFNQSLMIGNSKRDMDFGNELKMKTIFVGGRSQNIHYSYCIKGLIDLIK